MAPSASPSADDVRTFLSELRAARERLRSLAEGLPVADAGQLADAVDTLTEQLLVADEELRVQSEHLEQSSRRLDLLVAVHEELFAGAPTAYIQTDDEGVIVRYNHAARRLLNLPPVSARSRTLVALVRDSERPVVRRVLSRLRTSARGPAAGTASDRVEVTVRTDAGWLPVVARARRLSDAGTGRPLLHWELESAATARVPDSASRAGQLRVLAEAAAELAGQPTPQQTLEHIAQLAMRSVAGCDQASVSVQRGRGKLESPAATGELAAACDQLQYELKEGPCVRALDETEPIRVTDMSAERRWPRFAPRAAQLGVGSMLAIPLAAPRGLVGALNLYAKSPDAFSADDQLGAQAYAVHAGIALAHAELEANLRLGMETREQIGRAVGILMERNRITAGDAFDLLVVASQNAHRKLRDVAAWVNETGEDPVRFTT
jgi:PAS domain-containing protein